MSDASEDEEYSPMRQEEQVTYLEDDQMSSDVERGKEQHNVEGGEKGSESEPGVADEDPHASESDAVENELGTFSKLTHAAAGEESLSFPCLPLVSAKRRLTWLEELDKEGYGALLFVNAKLLSSQPGYATSWWFENRNILHRQLIKTPLESFAAAGIFTLKQGLPSGSQISSVMCTVSELIASNKNVPYCVSTAQLFLPSEGGFSQDFRADKLQKLPTAKWYRCFWYLPPDEDKESKKTTSADRECIFMGSAGANTKVFKGKKVLTLSAFYGEADRKFRMHPGDILVIDGLFPFAVDLPIGGRAKGARVLSWCVLPKTSGQELPVFMPESEVIQSIESLVSSNEDARNVYNEEHDAFEICPGNIGDPEKNMQRLRITPQKYVLRDIVREVETNAEIFYLNYEYFDDDE